MWWVTFVELLLVVVLVWVFQLFAFVFSTFYISFSYDSYTSHLKSLIAFDAIARTSRLDVVRLRITWLGTGFSTHVTTLSASWRFLRWLNTHNHSGNAGSRWISPGSNMWLHLIVLQLYIKWWSLVDVHLSSHLFSEFIWHSWWKRAHPSLMCK